MRYLDPKNDLTFKKIFGEHSDLLKSFLNSILPLQIPIESLTYLPAELVPTNPLFKNSIVYVRCTDETGRQFIVEMQMIWTQDFQYRALYNASKAFVVQLDKGVAFEELQPVYSLGIINQIFKPESEKYKHFYKLTNSDDNLEVMEGFEFVFIELPKFKPNNNSEKKLGALWLRFLSEIRNNQEEVPKEFLEVPEIRKATELLEASGYTRAELASYDKYWDGARVERLIYVGGKKEGVKEGIEIGREEERKEGESRVKKIVQNLRLNGHSDIEISKLTGLSLEELSAMRFEP